MLHPLLHHRYLVKRVHELSETSISTSDSFKYEQYASDPRYRYLAVPPMLCRCRLSDNPPAHHSAASPIPSGSFLIDFLSLILKFLGTAGDLPRPLHYLCATLGSS
jgi:hypothetical protein